MGSLTVPAGFDLPHPTTQILEFMMRTLACPLFRWLTVARRQLGSRRQYEADVSAAIARPHEWTSRRARTPRKPEPVEVTPPRLYVGKLSFDATESDLFDLFNGVGHAQRAEVVSYKHNRRLKGFAFVQMQTVDEAKRAVTELHDKEFLGRKLVVSGAKSSEHSRT